MHGSGTRFGRNMMAQQYIGVYATHEKMPALGEFPRPLGTRKRLWFVWEMPEEKYKVQALNAARQPMAEPRVIPATEFKSRFVYEPNCFLAPEGHVHPNIQGMDVSGDSLPDLFFAENANNAIELPPPQPLETAGKAIADDPNLLVAWAKAERTMKPAAPDPVKMPFDRLVGEVAHQDEAASPPREPGRTVRTNTGVLEEEAQQVRQLRSQFVQALLLLRRGARAEGLAVLEGMMTQPQEYFEGGAQLFSEFGLGLRRLGFIQLALAAHKRALGFAPKDERILFNIARTYHDLDLLPEARDYLEKSLSIAPGFTAARQFMAFLEVSDDSGSGRQ